MLTFQKNTFFYTGAVRARLQEEHTFLDQTKTAFYKLLFDEPKQAAFLLSFFPLCSAVQSIWTKNLIFYLKDMDWYGLVSFLCARYILNNSVFDRDIKISASTKLIVHFRMLNFIMLTANIVQTFGL